MIQVKEISCSLAVIGAGCSGMAAAIAAYEAGVRDIALFEIGKTPGGVLGQCIHSGFGLSSLGQELTGPEFSASFERKITEYGIKIYYESPVTELKPDRTMTVISRDEGMLHVKAGAVICAQGCRERPAGALGIPGTRPAGVMTAGTAQKIINIDGFSVGNRVVILGSGDIGLIMARRLTLEGAKVLCVCELMPFSNGLSRNIVQCLEDYGIPLRLSCTVTGIEGEGRLKAVRVAPVDPETLVPDLSREERIECDTLLLSVGLIPETGLLADAGAEIGPNRGISVDQSCMTSIEGVFAAGNVVQVHDLADFAASEGTQAGKAAADFLLNGAVPSNDFAFTSPGNGVSYTVPERILAGSGKTEISFRVRKVFQDCSISVFCNGKELSRKKRPVMLPGQMEKITLSAEEFRPGDRITVSVSENPGT